jgi:hypothetical protein
MMPKPKLPALRTADEERSLPELCTEAADHVVRARLSLREESYDAECALKHLDEAIDCLERLLATSRASRRAALDRLSA